MKNLSIILFLLFILSCSNNKIEVRSLNDFESEKYLGKWYEIARIDNRFEKNMIGNITGMICDGAKPSCAMKVSSGVSTAMLSALMAIENKVVTSSEGIIDDDVDKSIANLTAIGSIGMEATDKLVLQIMTKKA